MGREPKLPGQTVVVLGGSSGIGLETARRARAEGADVVLTGRNSERLRHAARELDARRTAAFDATDPVSLQRFFQDLPLVLKPGLVIYGVYNGYWLWGRPSFGDLRRDLREVTREIRPDWDLAAPGLRENWDAGDHSMHHPYQADHGRSPSAAGSPDAVAVTGGV